MPRASDAKRMTAPEYLEFEANAEIKHEFVNGFVFAMTGGTEAHNLIIGAIYTRARLAAAGKPCRAYMEGVKLSVPSGNYYYPDVFVSCNEDEFGKDIKTTACFVVEVLSNRTGDIDRGEKLHNYHRLEGLKAYVLVSQKSQLVEIYRALEDGTWRYETVEEGSFKLPCLDLELSLAEVYEDVELD
ncbi:MAG: Uma2 family endonuclease [Deinococcota bacterium]